MSSTLEKLPSLAKALRAVPSLAAAMSAHPAVIVVGGGAYARRHRAWEVISGGRLIGPLSRADDGSPSAW